MSEYFETFDEQGRPAGLVPRATVHRDGLWHRAAHVWLFRSDGRVYVQRRAPGKDVSPDCLDVSVGEHLQPGEGFFEAACRGLFEELGVVEVTPVALGGERRVTQYRPELGIHDREIQQAFRAVYDGEPDPEPVEVAALELWTMERLRAEVARSPDRFTPGLRADLAELDLP
ncbi:MAG: NUDIX hydrolase [Halofilum sp. (in: g-proteobacteria)]